MQIAEEVHGDVVVLKPDGALGSGPDVLALDARLRTLIEGGARGLVLDCAALSSLGSAAVRVLLRATHKLASRGGRLLLLHPSAKLRRALEVSGFDQEFALAADLKEALALLGAADSRHEPVPSRLPEALLAALGAGPRLPAISETDRRALASLQVEVLQALNSARS